MLLLGAFYVYNQYIFDVNNPTDTCTILEPNNPETDNLLYVVQKRRSMDFKALKS